MAGVQVPTLKRMGAAQVPATDKIEGGVRDTSRVVEGVGHAAAQLADAGDQLFNKFENDAVKVQAASAGNEYEADFKGRLRDLRNGEGDPTTAYQEFDKKMLEKKQDILGKYSEASPKMRRVVSEHLDLIHGRNQDTREVDESIRRTSWDKNTTNASNELIKERALDAVRFIDPTDPQSYMKFQEGITDLQKNIIDFHGRYGGVTEDGEGSRKYSPILKADLKKETSSAVMNAVKTLNDSGKPEAASQLMEMYRSELTNSDLQGLLKQGNESLATRQAYQELGKLGNFKDPGDLLKAMELRKSSVEPQVYHKMLEIADTERKHKDNLETGSSKTAFEMGAKAIESRALSGRPYANIGEFMSDTGNKMLVGSDGNMKVKARQFKALETMINAPSKSTAGSVGTMYDAIEQGQLEKWDYPTFAEHLAGMTKQDQERFTRLYNDLHTQTPSEGNAQKRRIMTDLKDRLVGAGLVKKGSFGTLSKKDQQKLNEFRDELDTQYDTIKSPLTDQFIRETNQQFVAKKKKGEAFTLQPPQKLESAPKPLATPKQLVDEAKSVQSPKKLTDTEVTKWTIKFKQTNKVNPTSFKQLNDFISERTAAGDGI